MNAFLDGSLQLLLQMGLPGLVIVGLVYTVYKLATRLNDLQEARINDQKALVATMNSALNANTLALDRVSQRIIDLRAA